MDIGSRMRAARLEAGLSQRQLCGDTITRNMLSQIENGTAIPSLPTLELLAQRLHKPMGYFFGEQTAAPEEDLEPIWQALSEGEPARAEALLKSTGPETTREKQILRGRILLAMARQAAAEERIPYAIHLLNLAGEEDSLSAGDQRERLLLLGKLDGKNRREIVETLPSLDPELLLRAESALSQGEPQRAGCLLDAAMDRESPSWCILRGRAFLGQKAYRQAADCFHRAEQEKPSETAPYLEICYRELEDFKQAYFYACRQKNQGI